MRPLLAFFALLSGAGAAHSATFEKLVFRDGQDTVVGSYHLRLEGPDNPASPALWQGPLRIQNGAQVCRAPVSLISSVWAAPQSAFVIVVSESGSSTYVHFIDTSSCRPKWPRIKAFTAEVEILPTRIRILPGCSCDTADAPCSCSAAQVYRLRKGEAPAFLQQESETLTKEIVGVEFRGFRKVLYPKTPKARLLTR